MANESGGAIANGEMSADYNNDINAAAQRDLIKQYGPIAGTELGQQATKANLDNSQQRATALHNVLLAFQKATNPAAGQTVVPQQGAQSAGTANAAAAPVSAGTSAAMPTSTGIDTSPVTSNALADVAGANTDHSVTTPDNSAGSPTTDMTAEQLEAQAPAIAPQPQYDDSHVDALHQGFQALHDAHQDVLANQDHPAHSDAAAGDFRGTMFNAVMDNMRGAGINIDPADAASLRAKYVAGDPDLTEALSQYGAAANPYNANLVVTDADGNALRAYKTGEALAPGEKVAPSSVANNLNSNSTKLQNTAALTQGRSDLADKNNAARMQIAELKNSQTTYSPEALQYGVEAVQSGGLDALKSFPMKSKMAILDAVAKSGGQAGDAIATSQGLQTRKQYAGGLATGKTGKNITAIGAVMEHATDMQSLTDALHNGDSQAVNTALNNVKTWLGDEDPTNAQFAAQVYGNEFVKAITTAGNGGVAERQNLMKAYGGQNSPQQTAGALDTGKKLLAGQLLSYGQGAAAMHSRDLFYNSLTPATRQMVDQEAQAKYGADYMDAALTPADNPLTQRQSGGAHQPAAAKPSPAYKPQTAKPVDLSSLDVKAKSLGIQ